MATTVSLLERKTEEEQKKFKRKLELELQKDILKDIYCAAEVREKEEEILRCIDSAFSFDKEPPQEDSGVENSDYSNLPSSTSQKNRVLDDATKYLGNYLETSHNTVYYSLVDESLVLSDFSDIHDEGAKEMSGCSANGDSKVKSDSSGDRRHENVRVGANGDSCNADFRKGGKFCRYFIDASNLTDESETSLGDLNHVPENGAAIMEDKDVKVNQRNGDAQKSEVRKCNVDQTPDSLDDDPYGGNCDVEMRKAKLESDFAQATEKEKTGRSDRYSDDILKTLYPELMLELSFSDKVNFFSSEDVIEFQPTTEALKNFKNYLMEKYESLKGNQASVDSKHLNIFDELICEDKQFLLLKYNLEEILSADSATKTEIAEHKFLYNEYEKKHGVEKTYNFIKSFTISILQKIRETESKPRPEKYDQTPDSLNEDEPRSCTSERNSISENEPKPEQEPPRTMEPQLRPEQPAPPKVELPEAPLKFQNSAYSPRSEQPEPQPKSQQSPTKPEQPVPPSSSEQPASLSRIEQAQSPKSQQSESLPSLEPKRERKESVTSKSYGFFIDLKDSNPKPPKEDTKEKSLPSKQLFSMFIDFGNSTDSDSSIGMQNKFERRKKQYFSKLEKSRGSASSLNDFSESSKSEKMVQSAIAPSEVKPSPDITHSMNAVIRRTKASPHPQSNRRSWNVDKPAEINQSVLRHKRSSSVSSQKDFNVAPQTRPNSRFIEKEFPSIGNADSTNELTVNGESEISNSYSEHDKENKTPCNSNSNKSSQKCSEKSLKTDENENIDKTKEDFVKLSDLDKEPKVPVSTEKWTSVRMTKSATGTDNWFETKLLNGSANSRSLSRIFPDISASILSKPNSDVDDTTISSISSVQSSSAVSTCESNLEVSNVGKNENSTLGQDLLRMFMDEISPDVVIEVAGRRIKAHKCILTSRCQYFAALLSGGWVESAGNVLSIHGFSYSVVYFALCYIYCGENEIPDALNIVELATLADMLCLEGLKEVVSYTLKMKYCHFFHKPCNICSVGVLECLPVAVNYGLDEIHRKSLRWITKHYVRLWCSKAFALLPRELIDKCYNQHIVNMSVNNVFETLMNCDKLFSFIPQTRWAEPCFIVTKRLHDHGIKYLANHFVEFLKSDSFTSIAKNRTWGIMIVDEKTQLACVKMRADLLCHSYSYVSSQLKIATANENEEFVELLNRVKNQVELALIKAALQASQCNAWFQMEPELRSHIQSSAGLTFVPAEIKRRVSSFKPKQPIMTSSGSRAVDLQQVKSAINRQQKQNGVRSESKSSQKHMNGQVKNAPVKPTSSSSKPLKSSTTANNNKSPFRNKYTNVKSRYMDRKNGKDKPTSETTPSETSEIEKNPPANRRPSKSLVTSAHLSPAIRQTARAVSLSKIPVSVRNSSQKRTESDKDTTSGSDNGLRSERSKRQHDTAPPRKPLTTTMKNGTTRAYHSTPIRKSTATRSRTGEERPKSIKKATRTVESAKAKKIQPESLNNNDNFERLKINDDCSQETKCTENIPSTETSISEDISKPNIPFRRDGTFCIDEPTVLKRQSPSAEQTDIV